jgi:hypothetical protein
MIFLLHLIYLGWFLGYRCYTDRRSDVLKISLLHLIDAILFWGYLCYICYCIVHVYFIIDCPFCCTFYIYAVMIVSLLFVPGSKSGQPLEIQLLSGREGVKPINRLSPPNMCPFYIIWNGLPNGICCGPVLCSLCWGDRWFFILLILVEV